MIRFRWDPVKAAANKKKHGVAFEEAQTVFYDETAIQYDDPDHSDEEDRFLMLGLSAKLRVLMVSHAFRDDERVVRIISARKATKGEESAYWRKS
jgi:uncharacterized DUF497 family protein